MTVWPDPVAVLREVITSATQVPTTRVLQPGFTSGGVPVVHVHLVQTEDLDVERVSTVAVDVYALTPAVAGEAGAQDVAGAVVEVLGVRPLVAGEDWVDEAEVSSWAGVRPYFEAVEVSSMTVTVTYRPLSD